VELLTLPPSLLLLLLLLLRYFILYVLTVSVDYRRHVSPRFQD
jgi:hypothetical protein